MGEARRKPLSWWPKGWNSIGLDLSSFAAKGKKRSWSGFVVVVVVVDVNDDDLSVFVVVVIVVEDDDDDDDSVVVDVDYADDVLVVSRVGFAADGGGGAYV